MLSTKVVPLQFYVVTSVTSVRVLSEEVSTAAQLL